MKMNVKDRLSGIAAVVDDHPIAAFFESTLFSNRLRDEKEMSNKLSISLCYAVDVLNMLFGNDQDVGRGLRIDVFDRDGMFILMNQLGRNLIPNDLAEDAVLVLCHSPSRSHFSKLR